MKILITGGCGFLGSHLSKLFVKEGHNVFCLDNCITGRRDNIEELLSCNNFKFIQHDISEALYLEDKLDWILHFASIASPKDYLANPIKTLKSGLLGTHNCLGLAKENKAKFFLASTSEVYGDPLVHPQTEDYWGNVNPIGVRSCYDESKRGAEAITYAYMRQHNIPVRVVRIFNTYGPNMQIHDGRVVSNFIVQALKGEPITIYGDGSQTRSFCYVEDLVRGLRKMIDVDHQYPINLGNPGEFTMQELADLVLKLTKSKSEIKYLPLPEDDPKKRKPDITKAKKLLAWQPEIKLEEGLAKTIEYFKVRLGK